MTDAFGTSLDVRSYWKGVSDSLEGKLKSLKEYLKHPSTGYVAERFFRDLIAQHVPTRFTVDTGFVVDAEMNRSAFIDVIIADTLNIAPFCIESTYSVFPIESVCAVIEVTTSPKQRVPMGRGRVEKFEADISKLSRVREMGSKRQYYVNGRDLGGQLVRRRETRTLQPRAFLITAGDEWKKASTYEKHLVQSLRNLRDSSKEKSGYVWLNAAFSLHHGLLKFQPYKDFKHDEWIKKDALFDFVFFLIYAIQTFTDPDAFLDIDSYRQMPEEEKEEDEPDEEEENEEEDDEEEFSG